MVNFRSWTLHASTRVVIDRVLRCSWAYERCSSYGCSFGISFEMFSFCWFICFFLCLFQLKPLTYTCIPTLFEFIETFPIIATLIHFVSPKLSTALYDLIRAGPFEFKVTLKGYFLMPSFQVQPITAGRGRGGPRFGFGGTIIFFSLLFLLSEQT